MKTTYEPTMTLREARDRYFAVNGFGENGGYNDPWVDFKLGPVPFPFPNTPGRVRAVKFHDLHHIITGFDTNAAGEFEISAWEIAAGCRDFYAAWFLNLLGMTSGALIRCPIRTFRAFVRGRRQHTMYGQDVDAMLDLTVAEARARFAPERPAGHASAANAANPRDVAAYALAVVVGLGLGLASLPLLLLLAPVGIATNLLRLRVRVDDVRG